MNTGDTTLAAFWWFLPAHLHDLRPTLVVLAVALVVCTAGVVAVALLAAFASTEPAGTLVDPARLLPMRYGAEDTVEVRR